MITKKYMFLIIAVVFAAINVSKAQTYTIVPNDTFVVKGIMEDMETLTISQLNKTNDTLNLEWEKVSVSVPANWEASVCDNKICYTTLEDGGEMNPIYPGETGFILLHITGHVNDGTALIRYAVWDKKTPELKDTLTFIMTVGDVTDINTKEKLNEIKVFPNPASSHISIMSEMLQSYNYSVIDISGKVVLSGFSGNNTNSIPLENIPEGIYNVRITVGQNHIYNSKIIVQH